MSDYTNPLQNTSYTNLDFQTIYPELLDVTKKLTNKWDPAASNESDPGVVLIKENAILADKINYNSDKNVLETFPLSVTQKANAKALFKQLGYYMKWYRSATTKVTLRWIDSTTNELFKIPKFTMVVDEDKHYVYTLLGTAASQNDTNIQVADMILYANGTVSTLCHAIEGVAINYTVNDSTEITADMLDADNRLWISNALVAENGIFICNKEQNNYSSWNKVDNLSLQTLGTKCYEFGISKDEYSCYIQFPDDAVELFEDGINITYIQSSGIDGMISARTLSNFYSDLTAESSSSSTTTTLLTSSNVKITNASKSGNGYDPETINQAYKNYRKTVGTFNTLVTLKDYNNYINSSDLVSNAFVTDRTVDPQVSYKVMHTEDSVSSAKSTIDKKIVSGTTTDAMTPYDLKLYLFNKQENIENYSEYDETFNLCDESQNTVVQQYISEAACLSHTFDSTLLDKDLDLPRMHFCYFINSYAITGKLYPQYELTTNQRTTVADTIETTLYQGLNSSQIEFGEEINYDWLTDLIISADSKIKDVYLDDIVYTTYAVVKNGTTYEWLPINYEDKTKYTLLTASPSNWNDYYYNYYIKDTNGNYLHASAIAPTWTAGGFYEFNPTTKTYTVLSSEPSDWATNYSIYFALDAAGNYVSVIGKTPTWVANTFYENECELAREEIYAKSVLAGKTQHFIKDETFDYNIDQVSQNLYDEVTKLTTDDEISIVSSTATKLRDNEMIYIVTPQYNVTDTFMDNVKVEWDLTQTAASIGLFKNNVAYTLQGTDYIAFYERDSTDVNYSYTIYGAGTIIKSTYDAPSSISNILIGGGPTYRPTTTTTKVEGITTNSDTTILANATKTLKPDNNLTSAKYIKIIEKAEIKLNDTASKTKDYEYYWITDNQVINGSKTMYRLFTAGGDTEYTLGSNEYFIYTSANKSDFVTLGAGTTIKLDATPTINWDVSSDIDLLAFMEDGISAIENNWFDLSTTTDSSIIITAVQNQIISIAENEYLKIASSAAHTLNLKSKNYDAATDSYTPNWVDLITEFSGPVEISYTVDGVYTTPETYAEAKILLLLSVQSSSTTKQTLLSNQQLIIWDDTGTKTTINGTSTGISFMTDHIIWINGSYTKNTNNYIDENNNTVNLKLWTFIAGNVTTFKSTDSTYTAAITSNNSGTFEFSVPTGKYLLEISHTKDLDKLYAILEDTTAGTSIALKALGQYEGIENIKNAGIYYFDLTLDITHKYKLTFDWTVSGGTSDSLVVQNIYKYLENEYAPDFKHIFIDLDYNNLYDYIYQIDTKYNIENPLDAKEFNSAYHIYNSNTICKWDHLLEIKKALKI